MLLVARAVAHLWYPDEDSPPGFRGRFPLLTAEVENAARDELKRVRRILNRLRQQVVEDPGRLSAFSQARDENKFLASFGVMSTEPKTPLISVRALSPFLSLSLTHAPTP